jgi:cell division protein FtsN
MDMKFMTLAKQRGGTMLGIIVGVLVGLGAALAVAVYVTKVPVPFVNKGASKGTAVEQEAAEAKKNKNWDPNAPLYGKNPAKSGAPATGGAVEPVPTSPTAAASAGAAAVSKKPAATASAVAGVEAVKPAKAASASTDAAAPIKPGSADPLGDLAKAKSAAPSTAPPAAGSTAGGADPFTYLVQAGAFRTPEDAESQRAKLGMLGMDAKISEREQSGRTVYRVRVGPFGNKDEAEKIKDKLDSGGFDTALVRVQR